MRSGAGTRMSGDRPRDLRRQWLWNQSLGRVGFVILFRWAELGAVGHYIQPHERFRYQRGHLQQQRDSNRNLGQFGSSVLSIQAFNSPRIVGHAQNAFLQRRSAQHIGIMAACIVVVIVFLSRIGLKNLVYIMRRLVQLERLAATGAPTLWPPGEGYARTPRFVSNQPLQDERMPKIPRQNDFRCLGLG